MSTISVWQQDKLQLEILSEFQQTMSRAGRAVTMRMVDGVTNHRVPFTGPLGMPTKVGTGIHDTPLGNIDHKNRWLSPEFFSQALPLTEEEVSVIPQSGDEVLSQYGEELVNSYERLMDQIIIDAALGDAFTDSTSSSAVSFDTNNQRVAVDATGFNPQTPGGTEPTGNSALTTGKLMEASDKLRSAGVPAGRDIYCLAPSSQITQLTREITVASQDFINRANPVFEEGTISRVYGINLIEVPDGHDGAVVFPEASAGVKRIPVFHKKAIGFGKWSDMKVRIDERKDLDYAMQISVKATMGATRVFDKGVVDILCATSTSFA